MQGDKVIHVHIWLWLQHLVLPATLNYGLGEALDLHSSNSTINCNPWYPIKHTPVASFPPLPQQRWTPPSTSALRLMSLAPLAGVRDPGPNLFQALLGVSNDPLFAQLSFTSGSLSIRTKGVNKPRCCPPLGQCHHPLWAQSFLLTELLHYLHLAHFIRELPLPPPIALEPPEEWRKTDHGSSALG